MATRKYESELRVEQAGLTRRRILDAAERLLLERGYGEMTVAALADAAGVSAQTIYNSVGAKAAVVKALYDVRLAGDDADVPIRDRPEMLAVGDASSAAAMVGAYAAELDIVKEGHDKLAAVVRHRLAPDGAWREVPMTYSYNEDEWSGTIPLDEVGTVEYTVAAWTDRYASWVDELGRKVGAGVAVNSEILEGVALIEESARRVSGELAIVLNAYADRLRTAEHGLEAVAVAQTPELVGMMHDYADPDDLTEFATPLRVTVDRERARFAAWYEIFPRSQGTVPGQATTFREAIDRLPAVARDGLRRPLHAADPPDRDDEPQGAQQLAGGRAGRSRLARGRSATSTAGTTRSTPNSARWRTSTAFVARRARARDGDRARLRDPVLARPPLGARAPRVVLPPPGRHDQVRREPAEEVRGHLSRSTCGARITSTSGTS